ncbi:MAG TPA: DoxX family protein [Anaerolineaceae bacterium]|nr:DoxX family protein [Anaerolineaceae bacterium]
MASLFARNENVVSNPPLAKWLFESKVAALLWLPLRIWLGLQWIMAAEHKITDPAWVQTGLALKGFWLSAVKIPAAPAKPAITFDWYRSFLQMMIDGQVYTWFAKLVAYGELLVGIALIVGAFVGIAAFFGALMNWNFMMAGSASTNPMLFIIAVGLILAWKIAGYIGADYFLLRWIGTPWDTASKKKTQQAVPVKQPAGAD